MWLQPPIQRGSNWVMSQHYSRDRHYQESLAAGRLLHILSVLSSCVLLEGSSSVPLISSERIGRAWHKLYLECRVHMLLHILFIEF